MYLSYQQNTENRHIYQSKEENHVIIIALFINNDIIMWRLKSHQIFFCMFLFSELNFIVECKRIFHIKFLFSSEFLHDHIILAFFGKFR